VKEKPLTPFDKFAARRIAEFPTLYADKSDVISACILGSQGDCHWKDGVIVQPKQHLTKGNRWAQYPLRMPLATAAELHQYNLPKIPYDIGSVLAPISNLPNNADKSFLEAIDSFLFRWEGLGEAEWKALATAHCLIIWQIPSNVHASEPGRTLDSYLKFMEKIPKWRAAIREVEHFQRYGEIDPRTFQGIDI
jgi:hypothetical protein